MKMKDAAEIVKTLPFAAARWYSQGSEYTLKFTKIQSTDSGVYAFRMYIHETAFRGNIGRDWIAMDHENLILSDLGR